MRRYVSCHCCENNTSRKLRASMRSVETSIERMGIVKQRIIDGHDAEIKLTEAHKALKDNVLELASLARHQLVAIDAEQVNVVKVSREPV